MVYHRRLPIVVIVVRSTHDVMATHTYDADNRLTTTTEPVTMEKLALHRNSGANVVKKKIASSRMMMSWKIAVL